MSRIWMDFTGWQLYALADWLSWEPCPGVCADWSEASTIYPRLSLTLEFLRLPVDQTVAQIARFKAQHLTQIIETEKPITVFFQNPFFGFLKQDLTFAVSHEQIFLKTRDCVFQNSKQQLLFGF